MDIVVAITLSILIATMIWCLYSTIKHTFNSDIQNTMYRTGVVVALILYLIGDTFYLIYQFDGMKGPIFFFHLLFVFTTFPVAITIDTLILLIFRVLNPNINAKVIKYVAGGTWAFYLTTPILSGYVALSTQPHARIVDVSKSLRFVNAAWYAIYHDLVCGYLIYLIYTHLKKKSLNSVTIALRNSLKLIIAIFCVNMFGLMLYGYALTLNDVHPLRFVCLNITNAAVGVQMNLLVYLFLYLTKLQFSDKHVQQAVPSNKLTLKKTSVRSSTK